MTPVPSVAKPSSVKPVIVAVVLAAGQSSRFGADKRVATIDGDQTVLQRTLHNLYPAVDQVLVVLKPQDRGCETLLLGKYADVPRITLCYAAHAAEGLSGSIRDAMRFLAEQRQDALGAVLIALADMPFVRADTIDAVIQRWDPDKIVRPRYQAAPGGSALQPGTESTIPGHPVLFGARWIPQLSQCQGDSGAKFVLQTNPQAVVDVIVDDAGILRDIDRPNDL